MHPNEKIMRDVVENFNRGDIAACMQRLWAKDMVVHVASGHPLSGEYRGAQEFVERFLGRVMQLTGGASVEPKYFLADGDRGAGVYTIRTQRDSVPYEWPHVNLYRFRDDRIAEFWWTPLDPATVAKVFG